MSFEDDGYVVMENWLDRCDLWDFHAAYSKVSKSRAIDHGEAYDTLWLTPEFMRMASMKKTQHMANTLLGRAVDDPLYMYNSRCLIQPPNDDSHCWDWHQEVFHAIPQTRMIQTYAPLIHDSTEENGTIEVLPGSHREGIANQAWTEEGTGYALVDAAVTAGYIPKALPLPLGAILFFDGRLVHRSGKNRSGANRYAAVGIYTAIDADFMTPKPNFKFRGMSPREYLDDWSASSK